MVEKYSWFDHVLGDAGLAVSSDRLACEDFEELNDWDSNKNRNYFALVVLNAVSHREKNKVLQYS